MRDEKQLQEGILITSLPLWKNWSESNETPGTEGINFAVNGGIRADTLKSSRDLRIFNLVQGD